MSTGGVLPCHVCSSLFPCFSPHAICFWGALTGSSPPVRRVVRRIGSRAGGLC